MIKPRAFGLQNSSGLLVFDVEPDSLTLSIIQTYNVRETRFDFYIDSKEARRLSKKLLEAAKYMELKEKQRG